MLNRPRLFRLLALLTLAATEVALAGSDLTTWNEARIGRQKIAMSLLGGWAATNLLVSGIALRSTSGRAFYFHQMNVYWNAVNLGIAALAYWGASQEVASAFTLTESLEKQRFLEKFLWLNIGLDCAYVVTGFLLRERGGGSSGENGVRLQGYGDSLLLQGGFLLVFDVGLSIWFARLWGDLGPILRVGPTGFALSLSF